MLFACLVNSGVPPGHRLSSVIGFPSISFSQARMMVCKPSLSASVSENREVVHRSSIMSRVFLVVSGA